MLISALLSRNLRDWQRVCIQGESGFPADLAFPSGYNSTVCSLNMFIVLAEDFSFTGPLVFKTESPGSEDQTARMQIYGGNSRKIDLNVKRMHRATLD